MTKLRLFGLMTVGALAAVGVLVACDGDDTVVTNDAGGADSSTPQADSSTIQGDSSTPIIDGGAPDVIVDAGLKVETYADQLADALCNALTKCCFNNANVPQDGGVDGGATVGSGHFDRASCLDVYSKFGFELSNAGLAALGDAGTDKVVVNQAKGADCVDKINTLACNLDGPSLKAIRAACFDTLEGQVPANEPCVNSLQCTRGTFCNQKAVDAGVADGGTTARCVPLRGQGGACGDVETTGSNGKDSIGAEIACSWRGGGDTNLACSSYDLGTGNYKPNRADWTCQPTLPNNSICNTSVSCSEGICDPGENLDKYKCEPALQYFSKYNCQANLNP